VRIRGYSCENVLKFVKKLILKICNVTFGHLLSIFTSSVYDNSWKQKILSCLKFWSYHVCRCFVGKRHLEQAIKSVSNAAFEVNWKPFFLNPTMTEDAHVSLKDYILRKYGPAAANKLMSGKGDLMNAGQAVVSG